MQYCQEENIERRGRTPSSANLNKDLGQMEDTLNQTTNHQTTINPFDSGNMNFFPNKIQPIDIQTDSEKDQDQVNKEPSEIQKRSQELMNENQEKGNEEPSMIERQKQQAPMNTGNPQINPVQGRLQKMMNYFTKMPKSAKIIIPSMTVVLIALTIFLAIYFTIVDPNQIKTQTIELDGARSPISSAVFNSNKHITNVFLKHKKAESNYPGANANLQYYQTSTNQSQIEFTLPVMSFFQQLSNPKRQAKTYQGWLVQYNANPRVFIDNLVADINKKMLQPHTFKDGEKIVDNLVLLSVTEITQIDIVYNQKNKKFVVLQYTSATIKIEQSSKDVKNLKINTDKQEKDMKKQENKEKAKTQTTPVNNGSTVNKQKDLAKAMENSIYYLKRVAFRNLQALRAKTAELVKAQKQNFGQAQITTEWQQALINECKTIEPFRFRCSLSAVEKLIPELTAEKLKAAGSNYVFTHALSIIFKQIEAKTA